MTISQPDYGTSGIRTDALVDWVGAYVDSNVDNVNTVSTSGTAQTIPDPWTTGQAVSLVTLTGVCVFTFPTAAVGKKFRLVLEQGSPGGWTAVLPSVTQWANSGTQPTLTTTQGHKDVLDFESFDGTSWVGSAAALDVSENPSAGLFELRLTQVASDSFPYSNGTLAGQGNWLASTDGSMIVTGNEATSSGVAGDYRTEAYNSDQYSEVTIGSVNNATGGSIGPSVRNTAGGQAYVASYVTDGTDADRKLNLYKRITTGGYTPMVEMSASTPLPVLAEGDTIRLVAEGTQITVFVNGVSAISANDAGAFDGNPAITGGAPGIVTGGSPDTIKGWAGGNAHTDALPAATVTDNFNRANGGAAPGPGSVWTVMTGYPAVNIPITSNQLATLTTGSHEAIIRTDSFNPDQWQSIQVGTVPLVPDHAGFIGLLFRVPVSLDAGYLCLAFANVESPLGGAQYSYDIYRLDGGASTWLAGAAATNTIATISDPTGTVFTGVAQGSRISFRVNGCEVVAVTDSTYSTGQPGIMLFPSPDPTTADNWSGGNVD